MTKIGNTLLNACLCIFMPTAAAQVPSVASTAWDLCIEAASQAKEAGAAEVKGGVIGCEEFLVERCGFRPIERGREVLRLAPDDCLILFRWSNQGRCNSDNFSLNQNTIIKQLNPEVFSLKKYLERCEFNLPLDEHESYENFREKVCKVSIDPR